MTRVSALLERFIGRKRTPVYASDVVSTNRYASTAPSGLSFREVTVTEVTRETRDATTIRFRFANGEPIRYRAGQFMTFVLRIHGTEVRRAYSFSSSPTDGRDACVTVKRIPGGTASTFLNESVTVGQTLQVLGPSGEFVIEPQQNGRRYFIFVAGGSGITPLMSLSRSLLESDPQARIDLLYGNRSFEDIIFYRHLEELQSAFPNFVVRHVLENPHADRPYAQGRLTGKRVLELTGDTNGKIFFVCGPEAMTDDVIEVLKTAGIPDAHIKAERFTSPARRTSLRPNKGYPISFLRSGKGVTSLPGQTVLEAGLNAGIQMSFSCAMGGCAACKVKVISGAAIMDEPNCLSTEERKQGYVLACVACAASPLEIEA